MRRFYLVRMDDVSGVSGLGVVAEGVHFQDGTAVVHWRTRFAGTEVYRSIRLAQECHGHGGKTKLVWVDEIMSHNAHIPIPIRTFGVELFIKDGQVHQFSSYTFQKPVEVEIFETPAALVELDEA